MKQLVNYYAEQGGMKLAKIPSIFKCEDEKLVQNYRPIFPKMVEKYYLYIL